MSNTIDSNNIYSGTIRKTIEHKILCKSVKKETNDSECGC